MSQSIKKVWVWTKLAVIVLVVAWVVLFLSKNWGTKVSVWLFFFYETGEIPLTLVLLATAVVAIAVFYLTRRVVHVMHQLGDLNRKEKEKQQAKRMEDLAKQVETKLGPGETRQKKQQEG